MGIQQQLWAGVESVSSVLASVTRYSIIIMPCKMEMKTTKRKARRKMFEKGCRYLRWQVWVRASVAGRLSVM